MGRRIFGFISLAITIIVLILVLRTVNWLPLVVQPGLMRQYASVEEMKRELNLVELYIPSYFPQSLAWPPSTNYGQTEPYVAIVMEFEEAESGQIALVISQASSVDFVPDRNIEVREIREKVAYDLKGRDALLEVGVCENEEPYSQIFWNEGEDVIRLMMRSAPFELIKIAESMVD
jgi:hypothetical protein